MHKGTGREEKEKKNPIVCWSPRSWGLPHAIPPRFYLSDLADVLAVVVLSEARLLLAGKSQLVVPLRRHRFVRRSFPLCAPTCLEELLPQPRDSTVPFTKHTAWNAWRNNRNLRLTCSCLFDGLTSVWTARSLVTEKFHSSSIIPQHFPLFFFFYWCNSLQSLWILWACFHVLTVKQHLDMIHDDSNMMTIFFSHAPSFNLPLWNLFPCVFLILN